MSDAIEIIKNRIANLEMENQDLRDRIKENENDIFLLNEALKKMEPE